MTITFEFSLSGGNKFELFVSDLMTSSDFERMKEVIELARDSLVITADEMKAEANRDAVPVEEATELPPKDRLRDAMNRDGISRSEEMQMLAPYSVDCVTKLTDHQCNALAHRIEHRLGENQATETKDPRPRIRELFSELVLCDSERGEYLASRRCATTYEITDKAARELVDVLERRLADEADNEKEDDDDRV